MKATYPFWGHVGEALHHKDVGDGLTICLQASSSRPIFPGITLNSCIVSSQLFIGPFYATLSLPRGGLKGQAKTIQLGRLRGHMSITNDRALLTTGPGCDKGTTYRRFSIRIVLLIATLLGTGTVLS